MTRTLSPLLVPGLIAALTLAGAALRGADAPPPGPASRDLVIVPVEMPQVPADAGAATMDWTDGVLRVTGRGRPSQQAATAAQRQLTAAAAAKVQATRNLALALAGAPVTSDATFAEFVERQGGKLRFHSFVRFDRVSEPKVLGDERVEVTLELRIRGKRDLAEALYGSGGKVQPPKLKPRGDGAPKVAGLTPADAAGPFTGLVVVADRLGAQPILRPQIFDAGGKRVYGPGVASLDAACERGLAVYARTLEGAREHAPQVGEKPLVIRAAGVNARNAGEIFLSAEDADRARAAEKESGFLKRAAVAIVLDAGR